MKPVLSLAPVLLLFVVSANAQTTATTPPAKKTVTNKLTSISTKANNAVNGANTAVNGANQKLNNANAKMENAASNVNNSYNKTANSVNKILNFGKTDTTSLAAAQPQGPPGKASDTLARNLKHLTGAIGGIFSKPKIDIVIKVPGANRAKLKELCELIKTCPNVNKKNIDFDDAQQSISVPGYKGKLNDLLSDIEKKNQLVTNSNTTASATDNSIIINLQ